MTKKTVLITGGNKGIGFETARQLAALGYEVFIGSRDEVRGINAVQHLKEAGFESISFVHLDVTNPKSILAAKAFIEHQTGQLDVLINNAGISGELPQDASTVSIENLRNVYETNFFGAVQVTQAFISLLKKSQQPRIVNVSSDLGSLTNHTNPSFTFFDVKLTAYCSSKTALNAYTVMLAYELREDRRFKINAVNPGFTASDLNGFSGTQQLDEAAEVIVKYACLTDEGPTGGFFSKDGETPW